FGALLVTVLSACVGCSGPSVGGVGALPECGGELAGFSHRSVKVNGVQLHYVIGGPGVIGGRGPAVVLLHGFPETWWTWRQVMPLLARGHTVIAPDLRGVGCSSVEPAGYDAQTLARDVHELVGSLGLPRVALVGHDLGGWVAYAYARQYRDQVSHLVLSGAAIPGFGLERLLDFRQPGQGLPHLVLFTQPQVPELLISGREREYFTSFIGSPAMQRSGAIEFYARSYARPGRLTAALGQYRARYTDAEDNRRGAGPPLTMPTLALAGVGKTQLSADSLRQVALDVSEVGIPDAGHYVQEERPAELARALEKFLT
ncbi:MAG: alpha/beta fold hydrolase, partial [Pseudonocardiaceae bacterium]